MWFVAVLGICFAVGPSKWLSYIIRKWLHNSITLAALSGSFYMNKIFIKEINSLKLKTSISYKIYKAEKIYTMNEVIEIARLGRTRVNKILNRNQEYTLRYERKKGTYL